MPIERQATQATQTKLTANSDYGQGLSGQGLVSFADAVSAYPEDLLKEYAEKSGYAYGFIQGLFYKIQAIEHMLSECSSPECIQWVKRDLREMTGACAEQLYIMDAKH